MNVVEGGEALSCPPDTRDARFSAAGRRSDASAGPRARPISRLKIGGHRFYIPSAERDRRLLSVGKWPQDAASFLAQNAPSAEWKVRGKHLFRHITVEDERADDNASERPKEHHLWEALLRFPNASMYHGLPKKPFPFDKPWPNLHTMRVIGQGDEPKEPIKHVYLLHNGLNETIDLLFHYRLAAWILDARPSAVCILRPLPGHLTRYPFYGPYASTPLDDYLRDPADLFRQFLRYMTETQWLLSTLVPRPQYLVAAGTNLLGETAPCDDDGERTGRSSDSILAEKMTEAWQAAFESNNGEASTSEPGHADDGGPADDGESEGQIAGADPRGAEGTDDENEGEGEYKDYSREKVEKDTLEELIADLRELLGWKPVLSKAAPRASDHDGGLAEPERPCIHVVGYSIGGFVAQAVFFAWPFAVSSCTSLFAGGALRDLSPTRFAHHEEWQAVLHGMRYELDRAFRDERLGSSDKGLIAGIEEPLFGYFTRIFYEVFLQYYRGGYSSRVEEFSRRLLFVAGGDDPIVRTQNVLDAAPNATLLQIGDVSHFPSGSSNGTRVESEQRRHWLPEVGKMIANFTEWSEGLLNRTLADSWGVYLGRGGNKQARQEDAPHHEQSDKDDPGILDNDAFSHAMHTLVSKVEPPGKESQGSGWLLIARNEVPPAFLERTAILTFAQAVHHSEGEITRCIKDLRTRSTLLRKIRDRVSLLVPEESDVWFKDQKRRERFYSKSETASAARIPTNSEAAKMWKHFSSQWLKPGAAREVKLDERSLNDLGSVGEAEVKRLEIDRLSMERLPDVWIALSEEARELICGNSHARADNESSVISWAVKLSEEWDKERRRASRNARPARPPAGRRRTRLAELKEWIKNGQVMAVEISAAELNARYRGRLLTDAEDVRKAVIHWALAYQAHNAPAGDGRVRALR